MWLVKKTQTGTTTFVKSEPGSNGNDGVCHFLQSFRRVALPPDAV